jgi:ABC-2 type transport system permease protein
MLVLVSMIMFFLYIANSIGDSSGKVSQVIITISKFTPFYWAIGSIEKSVLFPNVFILILMALVLFTTGNIRYSSFAKE